MSCRIFPSAGTLAFGAAAVLMAAPAIAADLAYPYPPTEPGPSRIYREERVEEALPPPPPPYREPRFVAGPGFAPPPGEPCRTIVRRRIDFDGEEVERRVRVCEEAAYPPPRPRYRPSFYEPGPPLPPADLPDGRYDGPPRW